MKPSVLIIGASRGLGLEWVRQYAADGWHVTATARSDDGLAKLRALGAVAHRLDVLQAQDFVALGQALKGAAFDVAIYNAGVFGPRTAGVDAVALDDFDAVMRANVWGAMQAVPLMGPAVARAAAVAQRRTGVMALLSSRMGSISQTTSPGAVVYRASKAALNMVVRSASLEWADRGVVTLALHPGWVQTDMGGAGADIDAATSVRGMRAVIQAATPASSGTLQDYRGEAIAW
jgi:NAD(P)-dependent dehydrogenase (short-subunit alcohol dehydrogenase family)